MLLDSSARGLLNDARIRELCENTPHPMLSPFHKVSAGKPSYGLSSCGYDLRLGPEYLEAQLVGERTMAKAMLDPLSKTNDVWFTKNVAEPNGSIVIVPGSFILGTIVEHFNMPVDVVGYVYGKSSYARLGLVTNAAPAEPGWAGIYSLALINAGPLPIRVHVGQGIAQVVFFEIEQPAHGYADRLAGGLYQNSGGPTLPGKG